MRRLIRFYTTKYKLRSDDYEDFFHELTRKRLEYIFNRIVRNPATEIFENENAFFLRLTVQTEYREGI